MVSDEKHLSYYNYFVDTYIAAMEQEAESIQADGVIRQLRLG